MRKRRFRRLFIQLPAILRLLALIDIAFLLLLVNWRSFVVFCVALLFAFHTGVRFVMDIHGFPDRKIAFRYLVALLFGIGYPTVIVEFGKKRIENEKSNWIESAGGPGFIKVKADNAVLVEPLNAKPVTYLEGVHYLKPFEIIRDVLALQNMTDKIEEVSAVTKDGIRIIVRDIRFGFAVAPDEGIQGKFEPLDSSRKLTYDRAMDCLVYRRSIRGDDTKQNESTDAFTETVKGIISSVIREYLNSHQIDQVTVPRYHRSEPRIELANQLLSTEYQNRFSRVGAKLLWVDVGYFDIPDKKVEEQRLKTWKAGWIGRAKVTEAYGDAQRLANQELGRAEAQAEMLNSIIRALDDVSLSGDSAQNLRNVILVRTAQIFESMTSLYTDMELDDKEDYLLNGKK